MGKKSKKYRKKFTKLYNEVVEKVRQSVSQEQGEHPTTFYQESCPPSEYAIIYKSELEFVSRCILDYPNIETGGQMFGYWTEDGIPVVLYTIGPGPRANHQTAFFNQDLNYLESVGNILTQKYGLKHIGEWHSHHQLGLAHPSGHDASTMANGLISSGRNKFLLCIGNCTQTRSRLNPFNFVKGYGTRYSEAHWQIKSIDSPFRAVIDRELSNLLCMPSTTIPCHDGLSVSNEVKRKEEVKKPSYDSTYWLSDKKNNLVLKGMMDFLNDDPAVADLKPMLDANKHVNFTCFWRHQYPTIISFPDEFPIVPPEFKICLTDWKGHAVPCQLQLPKWNYDGDILSAFIEYYNKLTIL